jgi:hypothetical protein
MVKTYESMFGEKPKEAFCSLVKNDHPEMDNSEVLDEDGITQYQSMIGTSRWTILLGCSDILTAIMTMSQFCVAPHVGHLEWMKQVYGYLRRLRDAAIQVQTDEPDYSGIQIWKMSGCIQFMVMLIYLCHLENTSR